jgi:hypothetical protein
MCQHRGHTELDEQETNKEAQKTINNTQSLLTQFGANLPYSGGYQSRDESTMVVSIQN